MEAQKRAYISAGSSDWKFHVTCSSNYVNQTLPAQRRHVYVSHLTLQSFNKESKISFLKVYPCKYVTVFLVSGLSRRAHGRCTVERFEHKFWRAGVAVIWISFTQAFSWVFWVVS